MGDAIMTIPALREVRRIFPQARLQLWTRPGCQDLLADADFIDGFFTPPPGSWLGAARSLSKESFQLALLLQNAFRPAWIAFAARIPVRCGYRTDGRGWLLTHPVPVDRGLRQQHQVYSYLHLVAELERFMTGKSQVDFRNPNQLLALSPERRERGRAFLARHGVDVRKCVVIMNPGATNSRAKQWPPDRFAAVADRLISRAETHVVVIGARDERELARSISAMMRSAPVVLTGETTLGQLVDILGCAHLLISNDTGPAHIGAALEIPTLTIFGPTIPEVTRPFSPHAAVVRQPVDCSPCMLRDCPVDHRCMTAITVDEIFSRAMTILAAAPDSQMRCSV